MFPVPELAIRNAKVSSLCRILIHLEGRLIVTFFFYATVVRPHFGSAFYQPIFIQRSRLRRRFPTPPIHPLIDLSLSGRSFLAWQQKFLEEQLIYTLPSFWSRFHPRISDKSTSSDFRPFSRLPSYQSLNTLLQIALALTLCLQSTLLVSSSTSHRIRLDGNT